MRLAVRSSLPPDPLPAFRIQPSRGWSAVNWREVWEYRELLYFLIWRDVKVRYKQTVLGVAWVVLQPLATTLVFTVIFGRLARMPSDQLPYAVFAMAGLVPWNFFAGGSARGGSSLVNSANLIAKVYFPRLIIPLASVLGGLIDLAIGLVLLLALALAYGIRLTPAVLTLPLFLLLVLAAAFGLSLWLAAFHVQYRDVTHLMPFITQFWFYATPVVYPASLIPEKFRVLYGLNPVAGAVEGFRWALFGSAPVPAGMLAVSLGATLGLLASGLYIFHRMEDSFADVV